MNFRNQKRKPQLSDIELIAIDLTSEYMGIDSELDLFMNLPINLESIRKEMANIASESKCYILDSMPLEVCKWSSNQRCSICKEHIETSPDRG